MNPLIQALIDSLPREGWVVYPIAHAYRIRRIAKGSAWCPLQAAAGKHDFCDYYNFAVDSLGLDDEEVNLVIGAADGRPPDSAVEETELRRYMLRRFNLEER